MNGGFKGFLPKLFSSAAKLLTSLQLLLDPLYRRSDQYVISTYKTDIFS